MLKVADTDPDGEVVPLGDFDAEGETLAKIDIVEEGEKRGVAELERVPVLDKDARPELDDERVGDPDEDEDLESDGDALGELLRELLRDGSPEREEQLLAEDDLDACALFDGEGEKLGDDE